MSCDANKELQFRIELLENTVERLLMHLSQYHFYKEEHAAYAYLQKDVIKPFRTVNK